MDEQAKHTPHLTIMRPDDEMGYGPKTAEQVDAEDAETDRLMYETAPHPEYYGQWKDDPDSDDGALDYCKHGVCGGCYVCNPNASPPEANDPAD